MTLDASVSSANSPHLEDTAIEACFLDIDGVFHDLDVLSNQWSAHVGRELALLMGGNAEDWSRANREVFREVWAERASWPETPLARWESEASAMLAAMCRHLGVLEPSRVGAVDTMRKVEVRILGCCSAVVPRAREIILHLSRTYRVHMATGNLSWRIEALLQGLGVARHVGVRAGPDLVEARKDTTLFYDRAFALAGVSSARAVVVDDSPLQIALATTVGARAIHVTLECDQSCGASAHIQAFAELPSALRELEVAR